MKRTRFFVLTVAILLMATSLWAQALNSNPLSDLRVRQAIAYAIDIKTICATILQGMALPADSYVPNGPWKAPDLPKYEYNPEKAKALLKEAGWDSNKELDLVYYYADQETADLMAALQSYLEAVGIKIKYRLLTGDVSGQLNALPADGVNGPSAVTWDLGYGARAALAMHEYFNSYKTGMNAYTPGTPQLDALIDATAATSDPVKQKQAFFAIEKYMAANLPSIPLYYQQLFIFENKKLSRNGAMYGNDQYNYDWEITKWTVTPDSSGKKSLYSNGAPQEFFQTPWFNPGIWLTSKVLWDRLITCDGSLTPTRGMLASSYKLSSDGMTLSFTLRDGIKWHDGAPITVDDVKWSIEYAMKVPTIHSVFKSTFYSLKGSQEYRDGKAASVSGIKTSGKTITLTFAKLDPNCLLTFSQWVPLPKKYLADVDPLKFQQSAYWQNPVGSGPFKVDSVKMNDYLVMTPFKGYWGGVAKIEQIVCYPSFENDVNVVKNAAAGKLDYGFTKNVGDVKSLQAMSHMSVRPVDIPYTRFLWINKFTKPTK